MESICNKRKEFDTEGQTNFLLSWESWNAEYGFSG